MVTNAVNQYVPLAMPQGSDVSSGQIYTGIAPSWLAPALGPMLSRIARRLSSPFSGTVLNVTR